MPDETTIRSTSITETTTSESIELKNRLTSVQSALKEIEHEVRKDAESIQRLRSTLDFSYLEQITRVIAELEKRITDVAGEADRARGRAAEAEDALREEQGRLEKLWDVYKVQEAELEQLKGERSSAAREIATIQDRIRDLESSLEAERRAVRQAQEENGELRQRLADADARTEELRSYEQLGGRVSTLESELAEERERLAKLYAVFEETQGERDDLAARVKQWDAWFAAHRDAMKGVCRAVNEAPR